MLRPVFPLILLRMLCQPCAVVMNEHSQDLRKQWFRWGIALAWLPSIPFIMWLLYTFRGVFSQKATGLGAIAGGLCAVYMPFVILATLGIEIAAIVLLIRSFSKSQMGRILVSVFSIGWSMLVIASFSLLIWGVYVYLPRRQASH